MITDKEALRIARGVAVPEHYLLDEQGKAFDEGWLFGWEWLGDAIEPPGGPNPFVVHIEDGSIEELFLPSDRGFEVLDKVS